VRWRGLGFRSWRFTRRHPRLVQCTVSGYGTAGPEADRPAYDLVLQAESGLMSLTGAADGVPGTRRRAVKPARSRSDSA
jgi:formyl-CoA transferase